MMALVNPTCWRCEVPRPGPVRKVVSPAGLCLLSYPSYSLGSPRRREADWSVEDCARIPNAKITYPAYVGVKTNLDSPRKSF